MGNNQLAPIGHNKSPVATANDGLVNVLSGLGTEKSKRNHNSWDYGLLNNWQQLDAAYQTNWIARQIVDVPADDITREWRRIKASDAEVINVEEDRLKVQARVKEALRWARLYGGAGILMVTGQDFEKPLQVDRIKKNDLKKLIVFDRYDMNGSDINNYDILADNYNSPGYFSIVSGAQRIHYSHFVKFYGDALPRRQKVMLQGWGDSVLRKCIEDVEDTVAAKNGIAELMQEANVDVITREGLAEALSTDGEKDVINRYAMFSQMKSIINLALLDADEQLNRHTLNLSGVAPIIEQLMTWVSGASGIPVTKLFGTSAKGLNATGEGDEKNYYDEIRSLQKSQANEPLRYLDEVLVRSATGGFPDDYDYEWNPLAKENPLDASQAALYRQQMDAGYLADGVIRPSQVMRELQAGEYYQFDDKQIEETETLEDENMFEEMITNDPEELEVMTEKNEDFIDRYTAFHDAGLSHADIMKRLNVITV